MKKLIVLIFVIACCVHNASAWGLNGHRVVGQIADNHISKKVKKKVAILLGHESLAMCSNWMDDIKSDTSYRYAYSWHYVSIPSDKSYEEIVKNPKGDVIWAIENLVKELKAGGLTKQEETSKLKFLVHLVGDIHQPLHVGRTDDRGGNDVKLQWFWEDSNLHRVWDSGMIDRKQLSYTELTNDIDFATKLQVKEWQGSNVRDWAKESQVLREKAYELPEDMEINYRYLYDHYPTVKQQLLKGGIRLAGLLNEIYG